VHHPDPHTPPSHLFFIVIKREGGDLPLRILFSHPYLPLSSFFFVVISKQGDDAPKPINGALVPQLIDENLADWAHGTVRVPASIEMDGYGSVRVDESVSARDVPFLWGLPFVGTSTIEIVLGSCLGLVQASDGKAGSGLEGEGEGVDIKEYSQNHLTTVMYMGRNYLNVDLSTPEGIARAILLGLGSSGIADVTYSPHLYESSQLFSTTNRGRLVVVMRHPVDREFARFRYLRRWDHGKMMKEEDRRGMSYAEFANSEYVFDNWMTRTLVHKGKDYALTAQDLYTAKEILRRKAVIGLHSDLLGAIRHLARYFGWDNAMKGEKLNDRIVTCFENAILEGMDKEKLGTPDLNDDDTQMGSAPWQAVMEKNKFDNELFAYSQYLYGWQVGLS
jgi:hypothetical protein